MKVIIYRNSPYCWLISEILERNDLEWFEPKFWPWIDEQSDLGRNWTCDPKVCASVLKGLSLLGRMYLWIFLYFFSSRNLCSSTFFGPKMTSDSCMLSTLSNILSSSSIRYMIRPVTPLLQKVMPFQKSVRKWMLTCWWIFWIDSL